MGPMGNIIFTWSAFLHTYLFLVIKLHFILGEDVCYFWAILDLFQIQRKPTNKCILFPLSNHHLVCLVSSSHYFSLFWLLWQNYHTRVAYKQHVFITHSFVRWNVLDQDAGIFSEALLPYRGLAPPEISQSTFIKMFFYSSIFLRQGYTTQPSFAWNLLWNINWPPKLMGLLPWPP